MPKMKKSCLEQLNNELLDISTQVDNNNIANLGHSRNFFLIDIGYWYWGIG